MQDVSTVPLPNNSKQLFFHTVMNIDDVNISFPSGLFRYSAFIMNNCMCEMAILKQRPTRDYRGTSKACKKYLKKGRHDILLKRTLYNGQHGPLPGRLQATSLYPHHNYSDCTILS